jgi:hypothetical protein
MPCFHSFDQGLKLLIETEVVVFHRETDTLEVASTSKVIKLFQFTANTSMVLEAKSGFWVSSDCQRPT